jgi:SAM-dependent methyltransferase
MAMNRQAPEVSPACPLCAHLESRAVKQLTGEQLAALWRAFGHEFSRAAWGSIQPQYTVVFHRCQACGFAFFDPALAGNEAFYRELERGELYYAAERPEFIRTVEFVRKQGLRRVLDVGCGSGAFLDVAHQAGCATCGIELNSAAGRKASAKGHRVFTRLLHELDLGQTAGGFDLISFFQVLEHLPDPAKALRQAAVFLNPGGCVSVSLPFRSGVSRLDPWEPHQWPPHHVSLWRLSDLAQLGRAAGLRLLESGGDPLLGADIESVWKAHNLSAPVVGRRPYWGGSRLPELLSLFYRKAGLKFIFPRWGRSVYAYYRAGT